MKIWKNLSTHWYSQSNNESSQEILYNSHLMEAMLYSQTESLDLTEKPRKPLSIDTKIKLNRDQMMHLKIDYLKRADLKNSLKYKKTFGISEVE